MIQAAESGPIVYKMTGPDRAALYRLALGTGFRANELRSLTPESFDLDGDPPTVTVKAAYSKHRREDVQPIRPDLAEALAPWIATRPAGKPIFGNLTKHTADMLRHDLAAAKIPYRNADGRVADFHAIRHSYVSMLARSTAPVKVVQTLARHSTPTLTLGVYSHIGLFDQTAALDALPSLDGKAPTEEPASMQATGTDGQSISERFAHYLPTGEPGEGQDRSVRDGFNDVSMESDSIISMGCNPLESSGLDGSSRVASATDKRRGWDSNPRTGGASQRFSRPSRSTTLAPLRKS